MKQAHARTLLNFTPIRILFYGDHYGTHLVPVPEGIIHMKRDPKYSVYEFGLGILRDLLVSRLVNAEVVLLNRFWEVSSDGSGPSDTNPRQRTSPAKLTKELLHDFDEIWFFGQYMAGFADANKGIEYGLPDGELDTEEVAALRVEMDRGLGVLILGDHSNPVKVDGVAKWLNLGRAIGQNVPRAGKMRVWEGEQGAGYNHSPVFGLNGIRIDTISTHAGTLNPDPEMIYMFGQEDGRPQKIYPKIYSDRLPKYRVHPLFLGTPTADNQMGIIQLMPDHGHEGALAAISSFNPAEWPTSSTGFQPRPQVIATGTNQLNGMGFDIISAYDGHSAHVGRIVAHTTWHHFVNVNLHGLRPYSTDRGQIAPLVNDHSVEHNWQWLSDYFANLAVWLAPAVTRLGILGKSLDYLSSHATLRDHRGSHPEKIGKAAYALLTDRFTRGQISDLILGSLKHLIPECDPNPFPTDLPSLEYLLGGVVTEVQSKNMLAGDFESLDEVQRTVVDGIKHAFRFRLSELKIESQTLAAYLGDRGGGDGHEEPVRNM